MLIAEEEEEEEEEKEAWIPLLLLSPLSLSSGIAAGHVLWHSGQETAAAATAAGAD